MAIDKAFKRVLAVDGGGSKTIAWIAQVFSTSNTQNPAFEVVGRGTSGPSNPRSVGFESAFTNLELAIHAAMHQADIESSSIDVACLSLAGAGRSEEQNQVHAWATRQKIALQSIVIDDVEPLRHAAQFEQMQAEASSSEKIASWEQSVTLVVGTGSIACGRNGDSRTARVGGWGYLLGDEGSGFAIGLAGLRAICHAHDQRRTITSFHQAIMNRLGVLDPKEFVGLVYRTPIPRPLIASISEIVLMHADEFSDARKIKADAIVAMADLVSMTIERVQLAQKSYSLALSGGILSSDASIVEKLLGELARRELAPSSYHLVSEPVYGSLMLAIKQLI